VWTILLFAAMFIFTTGLWTSGLIPASMSKIQPIADNNDSYNTNIAARNIAKISINNLSFSQLLSNVRYIAIYNNILIYNGFNANEVFQRITLAAASTFADNLTILGAASNITII
jgi:Na+/H+ antiporter NhaD/arsenite permease-like protein